MLWMDSDETWWMSLLGEKNKLIKFQFRSNLNPDPAHQSDTKRELISLVEVCALLSVALVAHVLDKP